MNTTETLGGTVHMADIYDSHVKSYPNYTGITTPYPALDYSFGCLLLLSALVGISGNILGAIFFSSVSSTTQKDWVALLYTIICIIDSITSIAHLPVAIALFRGRRPGVFGEHWFCALWGTLYTVLQKLSIFLVLLLSTFRTVIIVNPLSKIRIKTVRNSVVWYVIILVLIPVLQYVITPLRGEFKYSWDGAYCFYNFRMKFEHAVNLVLVGLPPILTFITLLVTVVKLNTERLACVSEPRTSIQEWKHRASITIAMFTTLFLVCNLPLFINLMHNMTTRFFGVEYPGVYFSSRFMFWYSWHVAKMESVVVNAALNPVLYYYRMRKFRVWFNQVVTTIPATIINLRLPRYTPSDRSNVRWFAIP